VPVSTAYFIRVKGSRQTPSILRESPVFCSHCGRPHQVNSASLLTNPLFPCVWSRGAPRSWNPSPAERHPWVEPIPEDLTLVTARWGVFPVVRPMGQIPSPMALRWSGRNTPAQASFGPAPVGCAREIVRASADHLRGYHRVFIQMESMAPIQDQRNGRMGRLTESARLASNGRRTLGQDGHSGRASHKVMASLAH
jgi:hypothetical protein